MAILYDHREGKWGTFRICALCRSDTCANRVKWSSAKKRVKFVFMRLEKKRISDILRVYETVNIFMGGML